VDFLRMNFDYITLDRLRQSHPAWQLLCSPHAPLAASFLHRVFLASNIRAISQANLKEALDDELFSLNQQRGEGRFPRSTLHYLNDWASAEKGWLRKFYRQGEDEPYFDLTPATEKALGWLASLGERAFIGTESRLLTLFALLRQIKEGSETDPRRRLAELQRRREDIDAEMARVASGDFPLLDDTALRDRFQQFVQVARELLSDFREVEQNFRGLDRRVRERIALWDGGKGALLEEIIGQRDAIAGSDQGKSFRAFWEFLMSDERQEEMTALLDSAMRLPAVAQSLPDSRLRRIHYDWGEAADHTQRTVAELSKQLRRFLDDQVWLENRRIMEILRGIEAKALAFRSSPPPELGMTIAGTAADIELLMERRLFTPAAKQSFSEEYLLDGDADVDTSALFSQIVVQKEKLAAQVRQTLQDRAQVTLQELCQLRPLEFGLAELLAYLQLTDDSFAFPIDDETIDLIQWQSMEEEGSRFTKRGRMPRVIFSRYP
jgi:hypothetical protein